jgi:Zn-dependent protease
MEPIQIALIIALIISIVMHEVAHGYAAYWLGDPTARLEGRLTFNPIPHIDPLMSIIVPGLLILTNSPFVFGAAKPVPYNPYNFRNQRWGEAIVAAAGPAINVFLAIVFAVLVHVANTTPLFSASFVTLAVQIVALNLFLAFFNLVPIPPLDGSKILPRFLPRQLRYGYERFRQSLEANPAMGFAIIIIAFMLFLGAPLAALTQMVTFALVGL